MNFLEKIKTAKSDANNDFYNKYLIIFDVNQNTVTDSDIVNKLYFHKNIPDSYKLFLNNFDGAEIDDFRFLTVSDDSYFETIEQLIAQFDEIYKDFEDEESPFKIGSGNLPIALDSGGNVIYLNKKGEVWIFYIDGGEHQFIASSFEEFMDEVVFGERYKDYYGLSDEEAEEDEWYQYLKLKGWVKG